jgi:protein-tyrosine phosphatase
VSHRKALFLCTGNYYRSRFAEAWFNHLAVERQLPWRADSRALAIERGTCNVGPISPLVAAELSRLGVVAPEPCRFPLACTVADLASADLIVALKEAEHRSLLAERFPAWVDRVRYWHVHDVDQASADEALPQIRTLVERLLRVD